MRYSMRLTFYILLFLVVFSAAAVANDPPSAGNPSIIVLDGATNQEVARVPVTGDKLKAGYDFYDPDGDSEKDSVLKWYKGDPGYLQRTVSVSEGQGRVLVPITGSIRKGELWYFQITPSDGTAYGDTRQSASVIIGNAPPRVLSTPYISPPNPGTKDNLQAEYNYFDPEDDLEGSPDILWYENNFLQSKYNNQNPLPASATERGDTWHFSVRPRDAEGKPADDFADSRPANIRNAVPEVEIISVSGREDEHGYFYGDITVTYNLRDGDDERCRISVYFRGGSAGGHQIAAHVAESTDNSHVINNVWPADGRTLTWQSEEDEPGGKSNDYRIGIIPNDGMENGIGAFTERFLLDNNEAPVATEVSISPSPPFSRDNLVASYTFFDEDGDMEIGSVIKWYKNGDEQTNYRNQTQVPSTSTNRDEEWYFTIEPRDGKEPGEIKTSSTVKIQNSPPEAIDVSLGPASVASDDNLEASYTYNDADGDLESGTRIRWYKNGQEQVEYEDEVLVLRESTTKGEEWYFTVQVHDGTVAGQMVESNHLVVGNMPPEVRTLTIPSEGFRDVNIRFDLIDADGDICSLEVDYRGGNAGFWSPATIREPLTNIQSNNLVTLTWESAKDESVQKPTNYQIRVTPDDGIVKGDTKVSGWIKLDNNEAPIASNLRILPPEPFSTDNLEASYLYTDPDGSPESGTEIIWYRDSRKTDSKGRILTASATLKGQSWHFTVKPMDGSKFGELETSDPVVIRNLPPFVWNGDVTIVPANPGSGDTLAVQYDYRDLDGDGESGTFIEWYKNGVLAQINTVNSDIDRRLSLPISKGERWYAVVTPSDGTDLGDPVTSSNSVAVDNAIPVVEDVTVSSGSGQAIITYSLMDGDGDPCQLTVEYQGGTVQGASWAAATVAESTAGIAPGTGLQLTWVASADEPGQSADNYKIRIIPNDGMTRGISGLSPPFSFSNNSPPTASGVLILPEMPVASEDLEASYVFVDSDGDREARPEIHWYRDGFQDTRYNNLTVLSSIATSSGERWYYTIRVNDGKEYGRIQTSKDVIIRNAPPEATNVVLTPDQPEWSDQLVAHYSYEDADGDPEAGTRIQWYRDGIHRVEFDGLIVIPGVFTLSGDEWYFVVTPGDGLGTGVPQASNKVFIANEPPVASGLDILPPKPFTTDGLQGSYIYSDPEGDPESGSKIIWYKGNVRQPKYDDTLMLPATATAKNQLWYFTVQPRDGKQFGTVQKSNPVFVENTAPRVENLAVSPPYPLDKDDLLADYDYIDVDGDAEGRTEVRWFRNDVWIPDYSSRQLPARVTSDREIWHFTVRPKDDVEFGERMVSSRVEIGNPVPRANNLTIMPRAPLTTEALVADYIYVDPKGIPEFGSLISWHRNGIVQPEYAEKILPQEATSRGDQWYFSVIPSNGSLLGEEQSSIPVTIINSPPTVANPVMQPTNPTTDDDIMVDYIFEDADEDVQAGYEIKWYRNGILQAAYNNMTELPATATWRNEEWYFTIRSRDDTDFSDLVTALAATIGNGRPGVANLDVLSVDPLTGLLVDPLTDSNLTIVYDYSDTEFDQESGSEIRWFKNDVRQLDYDDLTVVLSDATARDDNWYCTVRPGDEMGDLGDPGTSPVIRIGNTLPVADEILASSEQVLRGASVDIISYGQDADPVDAGAALVCQIAVRFGAGAWEELPTEYVKTPEPRWQAAFEPEPIARLGEYDFRARFTDSTGAESDWIEREKMIAVGNNAPEIDEFADDLHVPEDTVQDFDLRRYGTDLEDGETLTWGLDESSVDETLFQATISGNRFLEIQPMDDKNGQDDITITLTDTDGAEFAKTDVTIIIDPVNDPPGVPASVKITPVGPKTSDNLTCEASGSTDPDEDNVVVYRYQWYKDDVLQPGLTAKSVPYSRTSKDERWRCEVTPSDGLNDGPSRSAEVRVVNTLPQVSIRGTEGDTKNIRITFDLQDADSDNCDLKVEYRIKGKTWKSAAIVEALSDVRPGAGLTLTWQSHLDAENVVTDDCRLRVAPSDGVLPGTPGESAAFPLDNLSPGFTVTAIANPIHPRYIDVTVVSDEKLAEAPDVSADLGENEESITLDIQSVADTSWTGMFVLEQGYDGTVTVTVEGTDLVGNIGEAELQKEFHIPLPAPQPSEYALEQNYPNPVREDTSIPYQVAESFDVTIKIYNLIGQLVRTLDEGYKVAGFYLSQDKAAYWDGKDDNGEMVASGLYFYHFRAGNFEDVGKMVVVR